MKNKKNILIWGYYGQSNFGDDYNLKTITDTFKKLELQDKYNFFYTNDNNEIFENILNPFTLHKYKGKFKLYNLILNFLQTQKFLYKIDCIIFGGGTQYFEYSKYSFLGFLIKSVHLFLYKLARNKKVIQLNVGIGKVESFINTFLLKYIFYKSDISYLRDIKSYEFIKQLLPKKNIIYDKDLSYYYLNSNTSQYDENKSTNSHIGLNFIDYYRYMEFNEKSRDFFIKNMIDFITYLKNKGCKITIFPMQLDKGGFDNIITNEILKDFKPSDYNVFQYNNNLEAFHKELNKVDICFGMRYHFTLIAIQNNIPCVGLSYQPKVNNTFLEYDIIDYKIEMKEINSLILIEKFEKLLNNIESIKIKLNNKNKFLNNSKNKLENIFKANLNN